MSHKQNLEFLLIPCITIILVGCGWLFSGTADSQNITANDDRIPTQRKISIPLIANQLNVINGVIPVELKCDGSVLTLPNTLDRIPCTIKNNFNKVITAMVLRKFVIIDSKGKLSTDSGYVTIDAFVHPDFHNESKTWGLNLNGEPNFPFAQETYDGIITQLEVHIDYVEFADKQTLGPNQKGADIVAGIRSGAAKYKRWLATQFQNEARSPDVLVRLLEDNQRLPVDVGIVSGSEEQGALIYRNRLRKIYQTEGIEQLMKLWN